MRFLRNALGDGASRRALASAAASLTVADDDGDGVRSDTATEQQGGDGGEPAGDQPSAPPAAPAETPAETPEAPNNDGGDAEASEVGLTARETEMFDAGMAEMGNRMETVFASEHVVGREQTAVALLAAGVDAEKIVAKLETLPKGSAATDAMLSRITGDAKAVPDLKPGEAAETPTQSNAKVWDKALANLN